MGFLPAFERDAKNLRVHNRLYFVRLIFVLFAEKREVRDYINRRKKE